MPWTNYHSHSHYCDGKIAPEAHIQAAIEKDFLAFGCSSHASVPFEASWPMKETDKIKYIEEIRSLQEKYKEQIQVYLSLEVDYIPGMIGPRNVAQEMGLDYTVGSVHFVDTLENGMPWGIDGTFAEFQQGLTEVFKENIQGAVSRYFELTRQMLEEDCPDILGHMDKVKMHNLNGNFFSEDAAWYKREVMQTLEAAKSAGVVIELNTRGLYKKKTREAYPSTWILEEIYHMGIPLTLNSDSHHPREIDKFYTESATLLHEIGFRELRIFYDNAWQNRSFTPEGLNA